MAAAAPNPSPVLGAMQLELERSMAELKEQPQPPYFLSYEVIDSHGVGVGASFGVISSSDDGRRRTLDVDLRVGDYQLDSSHPIRGDRYARYLDRYTYADMPIECDTDALRSVLWYHTDRLYKRAMEKFTKVTTNVKVKVDEEDQSADFSKEEAEAYIGELQELQVDRKLWEDKLRRYTEPFADHGEIYRANAYFSAERENRWFVSSEGTRLQTSRIAYRLYVTAITKAEDGMELPRFESFFSYTPDGLPDDATVLATVHKMIEDVRALREAPVVDPYTGPAILSGRASAVFFHEIFGHRIEGQRQREADDAQTFKKKVGEPVLPESFSVIFDPTVRRFADFDLAGYYRYDNQGIKARPVKIVDKGILRHFLMSRKPIEGIDHSNGHGRRQVGYEPVSRQSNMIIEVRDKVSHDELRQMLIDRMKEEGKPFGLIFEDIVGGFTFTGRTIPNAFNVIPVMVYRIFPDGREELVRGVDLIGTPLTAFSRIAAADDQLDVFNGTCGAESGGVPVGAVSPGILVGQIEVQKKEKSQERLPLLPAPSDGPEE